MQKFLQSVLSNMPEDWLRLTTHRLDIYQEEFAKTEFLNQFDELYQSNNSTNTALKELPTAFDYIRLGHPLSCILEWTVANKLEIEANRVISFSSQMMPLMAILRKNHLSTQKTKIFFKGNLPYGFNEDLIKTVYRYDFTSSSIQNVEEIQSNDETVVFIESSNELATSLQDSIDFHLNLMDDYGSIITVSNASKIDYIGEIQHVRRRESIAMTPANCLDTLKSFIGENTSSNSIDRKTAKAQVEQQIQFICGVNTQPLIASSGLSIQYAIMMGLVDYANEHYAGKPIKFIVPPNCYGGTNDQARRVAACLNQVEIVDFPVDAGNDMVQSVNSILDDLAQKDAVPYIIAEIPTNPRVEVPDLEALRLALSKKRQTTTGQDAIDPVFILDQTFCPNVHFLRDEDILSSVRTIAYISGSKFPSGGLCTAGYCIPNQAAEDLIYKIEKHLILCDNEATDLQLDILSKQLPSMLDRIQRAYLNTREFVNFIHEKLPNAKINFVSEELAAQGFTPSVFSLDLPTKGDTDAEREAYKRALNLKLINKMITEIPNESKYCVSYGQLKGCYWTIPATSTQGTTKEGDKDYIARVAVSPSLDLEKHKAVFADFVDQL